MTMPDMAEFEAMQERAAEFDLQMGLAQMADRAQVRLFSAVTCTCRRWFSWDSMDPPQAGCQVHAVLVTGPKGVIL
jgi:hypothetical protein